jgi:hypothetical protein
LNQRENLDKKLNFPQGFRAVIDGAAAHHHPKVMILHHARIEEEAVPHILVEWAAVRRKQEVGNAACRSDPRPLRVSHWHIRIAPALKDTAVLRRLLDYRVVCYASARSVDLRYI